MDFRVLGPVEVWRDGIRCEIGGPRRRAVLARLLLARGAVVAADRIVEDLWGGDPPAGAPQVLQVQVARLRRVLEPDRPPRAPATVLISRPPGYALAVTSDAQRFESLVDAGLAGLGAGDPDAAMAVLDEALGLWWGPTPFADLADEPWLQAEITRLQELHLVAREQRMAAAIATAGAPLPIPALEALVAEHPLREGPARLLAVAYYRSGRQGDALATLSAVRRRLAAELGVEPGPALRETEAAVLAQSSTLDAPPEPVRPAPAVVACPDPLVGRDRELAAIAAAAATARPGIVVLSGEAGIGKTRLAEAGVEALAATGWRVVWGRCHESSGAPALWPWIEVLDALRSVHPLPAELGRLSGAPMGAPGSATGEVEAGEARFRQHHAVARYLATVSERAPLAVVLDDLQWADNETLRLLADLSGLARDARLLVLATARPGEGSPLLADTAGRLARHGAVALPLTGLTERDVAVLVGDAALDPAVLARRSGGNPFLLHEMLRSAGAPDVPAGAAALLRARLARLPDRTRHVLQVAAVHAQPVDPPLLAAVGELSDAQVHAALDDAALAGVLVQIPAGGLVFAHDLVRETLYGDLPPMHRARLHGRIVAVLEQRTLPDVSALAAHAAAAGAPVATLRWAAAAAAEATGRLAYDDAVRWWRAALDAHARIVAADPVTRVDLLLSLVRAQLDAGDAIGADESRTAAILAADETGDPGRRHAALVALDLPSIWVLRHYDRADLGMVARIEEALAEPAVPDAVRCRLLATLANELAYLADPHRSAIAAEALTLARKLDDPRLVGYSLVSCYLAASVDLRGAALHDELRGIGEALRELDHDHRLPGLALVGHLMLMVAGVQGYDVRVADAHAARAQRLIARLRPPLAQVQHLTWTLNRSALGGDLDAAHQLLAENEEAAIAWWSLRPLIAAIRVFLHLHGDRMADVGPLLPAVRTIHPAIAHDAELLMLVARGDAGRARRQAVGRAWPDIPDDWMRSVATCLRAAAAAAVGDEVTRRSAYDALAPSAGFVVANGSIDGGPADWFLGLLAAALGEPGRAAAHFATVVERAEAAGLTWWAQRARAAADPTASALRT
ncbi:BTAD domain-containing putative transcriptional regulator [Pseudonocardia sp. GCM10023141]|uniref:BTAD domain-containing putative transcriptional regulator n=1 Tax=Pseudonocardia sp. GCM10023141 TaxID=3252653 RepID=UPI0036141E66